MELIAHNILSTFAIGQRKVVLLIFHMSVKQCKPFKDLEQLKLILHSIYRCDF